MREVEKMYKNAGVEKAPNINKCYPEMICYLEMIKCRYCEHYKVIDEHTGKCLYEVYPPFTTEKQLELIKQICPSYPLNYHIRCFQGYTFEEGLAKCINNLWQSLTEEERKQIKEILK